MKKKLSHERHEKHETKNGVVPKLRFPEFRGSGEWVIKRIKDISEIKAAGDLESANFSPCKTDDHVYPIYSNSVTQEGLYGYSTYPKFKSDTVTVTARGTLGVAFYRDHEYVGIGRLLIISELKNTDGIFFKEQWNYSVVLPNENGGIPQLTALKAREIEMLMPSLPEQSRIADCLSSLDFLIAAHSQKLDGLKSYKKGLMQQLFPAKGEKIPKLRFPEFRKSGEWEEKKINEVTTYVDYRGKSPTKCSDGHFLVTAKNIKQGLIDYSCSREYVSFEEYEEVMKRGKPEVGDVLFTTEAPLGNVAQIDRADIALAQRVIKFRGIHGCDNSFLKYYLLSDVFQNLLRLKAIGSTVQGIQGKVLHELPITIASHREQQRIASFLSSIDNLITVQSQKIESLKTHKKGLMQQLFPVMEEANA